MLRYTKAIILSGGESSRFGQDKALIKKKGIPILDNLIYQFYNVGFFLYY